MTVARRRIGRAVTLAITALALASTAQAIDFDAPDRWWALDDASGTVVTDSSGNGVDGTLLNDVNFTATGGPTWTTGQFGGALEFDGIDDYVDIDDATLPVPDYYMSEGGVFTVSVWFKLNSAGKMALIRRSDENNNPYWTHPREIRIFQDAAGAMYVQGYVHDGSLNPPDAWTTTGVTPLEVGTWYHVVFVANQGAGGDAARLFLNGQLEGTSYFGGPGGITQDSWHIGRKQDDQQLGALDGVIDDIRVYNSVLSDQEVADLYDHTRLPGVSVAATDPSARENTANTATLTISVDLVLAADLTVNFDLSSSVAIYGSDYTSAPDISGGSVVIPAGEDHVDVVITAITDAAGEGNELLVLNLEADAAYMLGGANTTASATIIDEQQATFWIEATDATATEDVAIDTATFTLHRDPGGPAGLVTCDLVAGGVDAAQYTLSTGLSIGLTEDPVNGTSQAIILTPTSDLTPEADQTATLSIQASASYSVVAGASTANVTIEDNDAPIVSIQATQPAAVEDASAPVNGTLLLTRLGSTAATLDVSIQLSGTAVNDVDYDLIGTTVTFLVGEATATITVSPIDNIIQQPDRTVIVTVLDGAGGAYDAAVAPNDEATVTIEDDDIWIEPFDIQTPLAGSAFEIDRDNTFTWQAAVSVNNSPTYTVEVAEDAAFTTALTIGQTTGTNITVLEDAASLAYDTTYYWRVVASNSDATVYSTNSFTFTTNSDTQAPYVVSTSPASGEDEADLDDTVRIVFNEALEPTIAGTVTLAAFGDIPVSGSVSLAADGRTIYLSPDSDFEPDTTYTVTVSSSIADTAGNELGTDYVYSFTTMTPLVGFAAGESCGVVGAASGLWVLSVLGLLAARRRRQA